MEMAEVSERCSSVVELKLFANGLSLKRSFRVSQFVQVDIW